MVQIGWQTGRARGCISETLRTFLIYDYAVNIVNLDWTERLKHGLVGWCSEW